MGVGIGFVLRGARVELRSNEFLCSVLSWTHSLTFFTLI